MRKNIDVAAWGDYNKYQGTEDFSPAWGTGIFNPKCFLTNLIIGNNRKSKEGQRLIINIR